MKKTFVYLSLLLVYVLLVGLVISCGRDDTLPVRDRSITFGFASELTQGRTGNEVTPSHVRLTIVNELEEEIYSEVKLELFGFGDGYVSESVVLEYGTYTLTLFQILDEDGTVVMASPVEGSERADEVIDPLPIIFEVNEGLTTHVVPEVLLIQESDVPSDFGYAHFGFELVNEFTLDVSVISDFDSSYVASVISLRAYAEDGTVINDWSHRYESGIESIQGLDKSAHLYQVKVDASLYHGTNYFLTKEYLASVEVLSIRQSPFDFTYKYPLIVPDDPLKNEMSLYLPKDGCLSHARLDATGIEGFYLHVSGGYYHLETGVPLLLPNQVELFETAPTNLFFPGPNAANKSANICELIQQQYEDNPPFEVDLFVFSDTEYGGNFSAFTWDSTTGNWSENEE